MSMHLPSPPYEVVLAGAGRVGSAVAHLLAGRGHRVTGVWSRSPISAARARLLGAPEFDLDTYLPKSDIVLVGATDDAIEAVAAKVARRIEEGTVVCHFAGSLGTEPLTLVEEAGGAACALHPVQACPSFEAAVRRLPGSAWGITCAPEVEDWARDLIASHLDGLPVVVQERDRLLWHAAAVTAANGITALMAVGEAILGVIETPARAVLGPLAAGAVANAGEQGAGTALTGPIVRGDTLTVERHLRELVARAPDLVSGYVAAARAVLAAATLAGRVAGAERASIERALEMSWR